MNAIRIRLMQQGLVKPKSREQSQREAIEARKRECSRRTVPTAASQVRL